MKDRRPTRWRAVLRVSFSAILLIAVLWAADLREMGRVLLRLDPWYLAAFVAVIYVDRFVMAHKWGLLLRVASAQVSRFRLFVIYVVSPLAGIVLPATIGGDVFRFALVVRQGVDRRTAAASMVVERFIGMAAMLVLAAISLGVASYLLSESGYRFAELGAVLSVGVLMTAAVVGAMLHPGLNRKVDRLARRFDTKAVAARLHRLYEQCRQYRNHRRIVGGVTAWTFLEQMAPIIGNLLLIMALELGVSFWEVVAVVPLVVLAIRLPISLGGLGVQEGLYVVLFGLVGVSPSEAFLMSMVSRTMVLLSSMPFVIYFALNGLGRAPDPGPDRADEGRRCEVNRPMSAENEDERLTDSGLAGAPPPIALNDR